MRELSQARKSSRRPTAFTLIEVLLVLIILVILGALATNIFTGTQDKANFNATKAQIGLIKSPIDLYRLDMNRYPDELEDLWEEPEDDVDEDHWAGPYVDEIDEDPWHNPYQYLAEGEKNTNKYDFWSYGPDGEDGTDDDIGNWKDDDE